MKKLQGLVKMLLSSLLCLLKKDANLFASHLFLFLEHMYKLLLAQLVVFFELYDYLVMPICPSPAVPIVDARPELREKTLQLTTPASLSGLPALAVPIWLDDKRSVGLQFIFKNVEPVVPLAVLKLCKSI